jgi:subfamily B ATP-binding cassette protein MsbA
MVQLGSRSLGCGKDAIMRYFLRTLKLAWAYRVRLVCSLICALFAAVLWSLNFTAIYPALTILASDKNLQQWVDDSIDKIEKERIKKAQKEIDASELWLEQINKDPNHPEFPKLVRQATRALSNHQSDLDSALREKYHLQQAKKYIDAFFPTDRFETLALLIGLVLLAVAIKGIFEFAQDSLVGSVVNLVLFDIRNLFFRRAIKMDVAQFGEQGTHELMSRFTTDTEMMGTGLKTLFGRVVAEPLRACACVVVACLINWKLTTMFLVLVPISLYILTKVGRLMKRATRRLLERMSSIYQILQESFTGIRIVKAFCREPQRRRKFREATRDYYRKAMLVVNLDSLAGPVIEILGVAAIGGALLVGAYLVIKKESTIFGIRMCDTPLEMASLLQLYCSLAAVADPIRKLSSVFTKIQSGAAASDRVFRYIDREARIVSSSASELMPRHERAVEFQNVCFSYDHGHPILTGVNLRVEHGQIVAIVGKNGCGKSTLLNLLPRFYDPDHGTVTIDGQDVRSSNLRSVRRQIGIVTQETFLFADTIRNNIAFGRPRASLEQIEDAARKAQAHDFIAKMPHGYETKLGEAGVKISVGQRQKLCLARAILADPSILLLDEFTSAADAESEMEIHRALRDFMKGRTCFVITHRLNTLEMADRIIVVDGGKVAAQGSHAELMRISPLYERLYEAHFQRKAA